MSEISGLLLVVIMILMMTDFITRYFGKPIDGLYTLSIFTLITTVYFGLPFCEQQHSHIRVEIITSKISGKLKCLLIYIRHILSIVMISFCSLAICKDAIKSFASKETMSTVPPFLIYPVKFAIAIGCIFYLFQLVINMMKESRKINDNTN